jgi:hypothetical protein
LATAPAAGTAKLKLGESSRTAVRDGPTDDDIEEQLARLRT